MSALGAWAIVCGVGLGLGLWSMIAVLPRFSRPTLANRVAPYVVDVSEGARAFTARTTVHPIPLLGDLVQPLVGGAARALVRVVGPGDSIAVRLRQAGSRTGVEQFRVRQVLFMVIGVMVGVAADLVVGSVRAVPLIAQVTLPLVLAACGYASADWMLKRAARSRLRRIEAEFPTVVEFLTLSLSAGEGVADAIRRVARVGSGELARELSAAITEINSGIPIAAALTDMSRSIRLPMLTRFIDAITAALERGTPLTEVLRAQAADARSQAKRDLLEAAGKKDVAMLVPLVFLILPCTILFAIYPGLFVLQSGF